MKAKRDAGLRKLGIGSGAGSGIGIGGVGGVAVGASSSSNSTSKKLRGRPSKEATAGKTAKLSAKPSGSKSCTLTAARVAHVIGQLDNKRGSTMESIRSKLMRSGQIAKTSLIRTALERAVKAGILKEVREERFSLPKGYAASGSSSSRNNSASSSRTRNTLANKGSVKRVPSGSGQRGKVKMPMKMAKRSVSRGEAKLRQRRPPQGRRPAVTSASGGAPDANEEGDIRDEDDTGVGDGDIDDGQSCNGGTTEKGSSRVSVSEPVAGCDAVMVFGTH